MTEKVRVLVVDDAAFMRRTLIKLLRQAADVEIVGEARDGREAVELFNETRPDVVCLDVDMPEMDGVTALKHFMSTRPTPVIVVSSMTDRDNIPFELFRLGAIDFFPKPSSLVGAIEEQTKLLLYLVRNAKQIRVENLARVPVHRTSRPVPAPGSPRHLLVVGGVLGSVGALIRLLALLPPQAQSGVSILCMTPLHEAIAASFQGSIAELFGWETESLETVASLGNGRVVVARPTSSVELIDELTCAARDGDGRPLDEMFASAGTVLGDRATMILLAGSEPHGVDGLAIASSQGSSCFIQDPGTALFATWQPKAPLGVRLLDLEAVAASVRQRVGCSASESDDRK